MHGGWGGAIYEGKYPRGYTVCTLTSSPLSYVYVTSLPRIDPRLHMLYRSNDPGTKNWYRSNPSSPRKIKTTATKQKIPVKSRTVLLSNCALLSYNDFVPGLQQD